MARVPLIEWFGFRFDLPLHKARLIDFNWFDHLHINIDKFHLQKLWKITKLREEPKEGNYPS
jgi:hypothetical protein